MRRRTLALVAALLLASFAWAGDQVYNNASVSVTQTNTSLTFTDNGSGGSSAAFKARHVVVHSLSTSANTCYFDLKDTTATTSDTWIEPGGTWERFYEDPPNSPGGGGWSGMGAICASSETATFLVTATR